MPGDAVILEGNHILINNTIVATVQAQDSQGLPLRPAALVNPIPTGHYFVTLPHPRSFDSRYIGLIRREDVIGVARPIF
jgi:type IV secretory pathway protease TraF